MPPENLSCNYIVLLYHFPLSYYILANEADEGLNYKGRKASGVTRDSASNGNSYYEARAMNGEQQARTSCTSNVSHSGLLQGNVFGRRKNLQNRKTKNSKNFSHRRGMA